MGAYDMRIYVRWAICSLYLTVAAFCDAAVFTPVPINCTMLDSSLVADLDKRIEVSASGFSVLPPQGENWCVKSMASKGLSFLKTPARHLFSDSPARLMSFSQWHSKRSDSQVSLWTFRT